MATFTIERKEMDFVKIDLYTLTVRCEGKRYLRIPTLSFMNYDLFSFFNETIHVPYGASCELVVVAMHEVALYYGKDMGSRPIRVRSGWDGGGWDTFWNVPASKCIVQTLSNYSDSTFNESSAQGMAVQTLVNDGLSDSMCNQDPGLILERYALTLLSHSLGLESPFLDLHQCYGWGLPDLEISCENENEKVLSLVLLADDGDSACEACQGTIPTELSLLSHLGKYNLAPYISTLEWHYFLY
jgi:hypothetical protein